MTLAQAILTFVSVFLAMAAATSPLWLPDEDDREASKARKAERKAKKASK